MTQVRITVDSSGGGDLEATTELVETIQDNHIRAAVILTANRILRGYGLEEIKDDR